MSLVSLITRSATYHWRTNVAIVFGVAVAVAVLAGALVVGDSVRGSLRDIALGRLGRTDGALMSVGFFREAVAADLRTALGAEATSPLLVATGFVTLESSGRRASNVSVYGVDERFWTFNGQPAADGVYVSSALATEVGARQGDVLLTRLQKPSEIPVESLFGRKEDAGRTLRLTVAGALPRDRLGEFALRPQQTEVRAVFAPLQRIQRDLGLSGRVNTVLVAGGRQDATAVRSALTLEDLGVNVVSLETPPTIVVESASGVMSEALEAAMRRVAEKERLAQLPVFTYLANSIQKGDRLIPYSLITATHLSALPDPRSSIPDPRSSIPDPIILNDWAARELGASPGDPIEIEYYLWDPTAGLLTRTASFTLDRVVPIAGLAADRRLAPEYPGITGSNSLADWDPPFPIDLSRVRPVDEKYWDEYRTTPKAFIPYERGRELWQTRYGSLTSLRFPLQPQSNLAELLTRVRLELRDSLSPQAMGLTFLPVRASALAASRGATNFGEYFTYFSFFLVVSALLLAVLFFRLGVEQRLKQIGILRAGGYAIAAIRRLLLGEAAVLAIAGSVLGMAGAVAYGAIIVHGLRTWWVGAVGTTLLDLHVRPVSLLLGATGGIVAAIACIVVSLRAVGRLSPRSLLMSQTVDQGAATDARRSPRRVQLASLLAVASVALLILGFARRSTQAGAFFGAGAALLVASLLFLSAWLRARAWRPVTGRGSWAVARLGFRSATFRPGRSVLSAALIATATFIIVSVDAFRRGGGELTEDRQTGTGGYVLFAESELPLLHNPNEPEGLEALMVRDPELSYARFTRFRVRPGEDASCLNLYRPTNPTIVAPEAGFVDSGRFGFSSSMAQTDQERANPWLLLRRTFDDGAVPVVADATSLQYVLHLGVGDTLLMDTGAERPLLLRFVASLSDSILQGELVMAEEQFVRLFPHQQGYRLFLIDHVTVRSNADAERLVGIVERELQAFGVDAVTTSERLEEFHRVENTYLSTFQALGGLGLLLGTIGLTTVMFRNVLERRRELALLRAVGYNARRVSTMIVAETAFLLGAGLLAGAASAAIAIAPAWAGRGTLPGVGMAVLLVAVIAAGILSSQMATRAALGGPVLDGLRAE